MNTITMVMVITTDALFHIRQQKNNDVMLMLYIETKDTPIKHFNHFFTFLLFHLTILHLRPRDIGHTSNNTLYTFIYYIYIYYILYTLYIFFTLYL